MEGVRVLRFKVKIWFEATKSITASDRVGIERVSTRPWKKWL